MEKRFDLKRFGLMVRWDLMTNWKSSLRVMLGIALGLLLMYELDMISTHGSDASQILPSQWHYRMEHMVEETNFIFVMFMVVGAGLMFACMKTRQQRTAFIMLPASPAEKFLARLLYVTAGFFVMFFAATVIADVLRLIICLIVGPRIFSSVVLTGMGDLYDGVTGLLIGWNERMGHFWLYTKDRTEGMWNMAMFVSLALFTHALFILGGAFFRRQAPLLSMFSVIGIWIMMVWIYGHSGEVALVIGDRLYGFISSNRVIPFIFGTLTGLCYWGAYRIFLRMQVINNKWINL